MLCGYVRSLFLILLQVSLFLFLRNKEKCNAKLHVVNNMETKQATLTEFYISLYKIKCNNMNLRVGQGVCIIHPTPVRKKQGLCWNMQLDVSILRKLLICTTNNLKRISKFFSLPRYSYIPAKNIFDNGEYMECLSKGVCLQRLLTYYIRNNFFLN